MATINPDIFKVNYIERNTDTLKKDVDEMFKTFSQQLNDLHTSFNIDMSVYNSLCQHIVEDLYQAKLSILYDEYNALMMTKELQSFQQYQNLLLEVPWYKKIFKFQKKKLQKQAEKETEKKFKKRLDQIQEQIKVFTYENYVKQFEDDAKEKYQAVEEAINCQHSSYEMHNSSINETEEENIPFDI